MDIEAIIAALNFGWIKLWRILLTKAIWKESVATHQSVLITILLMANHAKRQFIWKGEKITGEPGTFVTSAAKIAENAAIDVTPRIVRRAIHNFAKIYDFLSWEGSQGWSRGGLGGGLLITIHNFEEYQLSKEELGQLLGQLEGNGDGQKAVTKRSIYKNERSNKRLLPENFLTAEENLSKLFDYYTSKGCLALLFGEILEDFKLYHRKKGSKFSDWNAAWQTWVRNEVKYHPERHKIENSKAKWGMKTVDEMMDGEENESPAE